jgi:glutamine amidotransferase
MINKKKITIVDYGIGNIMSLKMAIESLGCEAILSRSPEEILSSKYIILPGVGSFGNAISKIKKFKLNECLQEAFRKKIFILGICLGAQILMTKSEEFGINYGLDFIPGKVINILNSSERINKYIKLPHIGWSNIHIEKNLDQNSNLLMKDIETKKDYFYFIHSYIGISKNICHQISFTTYENLKIPAVFGFENIFGCQFHPEKSGKSGIKFLNNFINLN